MTSSVDVVVAVDVDVFEEDCAGGASRWMARMVSGPILVEDKSCDITVAIAVSTITERSNNSNDGDDSPSLPVRVVKAVDSMICCGGNRITGKPISGAG